MKSALVHGRRIFLDHIVEMVWDSESLVLYVYTTRPRHVIKLPADDETYAFCEWLDNAVWWKHEPKPSPAQDADVALWIQDKKK